MQPKINHSRVVTIQDWFSELGLTIDYRTAERFTEAMLEIANVKDKPDLYVEESEVGVTCKTTVPISSYCKHHVLQWFGWVDVVYTPAGLVLGLSKFHRIVEWASQGLKLQEEVTQLIGRELTEVLGPNSQVQVEVRAYHTCAITRGVKADSDFEYLTGYFNNAPD